MASHSAHLGTCTLHPEPHVQRGCPGASTTGRSTLAAWPPGRLATLLICTQTAGILDSLIAGLCDNAPPRPTAHLHWRLPSSSSPNTTTKTPRYSHPSDLASDADSLHRSNTVWSAPRQTGTCHCCLCKLLLRACPLLVVELPYGVVR